MQQLAFAECARQSGEIEGQRGGGGGAVDAETALDLHQSLLVLGIEHGAIDAVKETLALFDAKRQQIALL